MSSDSNSQFSLFSDAQWPPSLGVVVAAVSGSMILMLACYACLLVGVIAGPSHVATFHCCGSSDTDYFEVEGPWSFHWTAQAAAANTAITLRDEAGRVVARFQAEEETTFSTSNLAAGKYCIRVEHDAGRWTIAVWRSARVGLAAS